MQLLNCDSCPIPRLQTHCMCASVYTYIYCICLVICPEHWWWARHLDDLNLAALGICSALEDLKVAAAALILQEQATIQQRSPNPTAVFSEPAQRKLAMMGCNEHDHHSWAQQSSHFIHAIADNSSVFCLQSVCRFAGNWLCC